MQQRCNNPKDAAYKHYGGRGIKICERWSGKDGFKNFQSDMGDCPPGLTIERINNDAGYSPENCRWATYKEQAQNRRKPKMPRTGRLVEWRGQSKTIPEWAKLIGVKPAQLYERMWAGWSVERMLTEPTVYERKAANQSRYALIGAA